MVSKVGRALCYAGHPIGIASVVVVLVVVAIVGNGFRDLAGLYIDQDLVCGVAL